MTFVEIVVFFSFSFAYLLMQEAPVANSFKACILGCVGFTALDLLT